MKNFAGKKMWLLVMKISQVKGDEFLCKFWVIAYATCIAERVMKRLHIEDCHNPKVWVKIFL